MGRVWYFLLGAFAASWGVVATGVCDEEGDRIMTWRIHVPAGAKATLQQYIDWAQPGDTLIVPPGDINQGGRRTREQGPITRVVIDKPLTVKSSEGADVTFITGGAAIRAVYMTNDVRLIGFTIRGGETLPAGAGGNKFLDLSGGGVWSEPGGILDQCIIENNRALWFGGGLYGGRAERTIFRNNEARRSGGGASHAVLISCLLHDNRAGRFGGGAHRCAMLHVTVSKNRAESMGGGAAYGVATNSVFYSNQTLLSGHNVWQTALGWSCSEPLEPGEGNMDVDPLLRNPSARSFFPQPGSPLIDAGTNVCFIATDLNGQPRIQDGRGDGTTRADIGAYELPSLTSQEAVETARRLGTE